MNPKRIPLNALAYALRHHRDHLAVITVGAGPHQVHSTPSAPVRYMEVRK